MVHFSGKDPTISHSRLPFPTSKVHDNKHLCIIILMEIFFLFQPGRLRFGSKNISSPMDAFPEVSLGSHADLCNLVYLNFQQSSTTE